MATNDAWPESFGFSLVGEGPCYVISVQRAGVAHSAGIVPGDQLIELDGHNVSDMSADAIRTLARHSRTVPPTVGVVSRLQYVELIASRRWGYGLTLNGTKPTVVDTVDPPGPAYLAGIREGDIILEVNGHKVRNLDLVKPLLSTRYGKLTLAVIPVDSHHVTRTTSSGAIQPDASRVRKARDLFSKMNVILGRHYEKKMAVVGLLKKYAEDRNVETFASGLNLVLKSSEEKKLIRDLRPFVPVKHRQRFDSLLDHDPLGEPQAAPPVENAISSSLSTLNRERQPAAVDGRIREVTILRDADSFGFVLRGHNPVYVESVTPGGPADRAGLLPGDAILKLNGLDVSRSSHSHVIQLLQGSGSSPRLQVRQLLDDHGVPMMSPRPAISDESSTSSRASSSGWFGDESSGAVLDGSGRTFKQQVDHLLTGREKAGLRKALVNYNVARNVIQLVDELEPILDAPSKRTLWNFILPRMSADHRLHVTQHVHIPSKHSPDYKKRRPRHHHRNNHDFHTNVLREPHAEKESPASNWSGVGAASPSSGRSPAEGGEKHHLGSFKQQLEYLLTSRERSQLKKALQIYSQKRNPQHLLEDLSAILDTPSKQTLWFYIIPLLSPPHQRFCQRKLGLPSHVIRTGVESMRPPSGAFANGYGSSSDFGEEGPASPRKGDVIYQQDDDFTMVHQAASILKKRDLVDFSDEDSLDGGMSSGGLSATTQVGGGRGRRRVPRDRDRGPPHAHRPPAGGISASPSVISAAAPSQRSMWEEGEQATVTITPEYVDAWGGTSKPKVKMVREMMVQTSPRGSFRELRTLTGAAGGGAAYGGSGGDGGDGGGVDTGSPQFDHGRRLSSSDYKTIVKNNLARTPHPNSWKNLTTPTTVYENPARAADIIEVKSGKPRSQMTADYDNVPLYDRGYHRIDGQSSNGANNSGDHHQMSQSGVQSSPSSPIYQQVNGVHGVRTSGAGAGAPSGTGYPSPPGARLPGSSRDHQPVGLDRNLSHTHETTYTELADNIAADRRHSGPSTAGSPIYATIPSPVNRKPPPTSARSRRTRYVSVGSDGADEDVKVVPGDTDDGESEDDDEDDGGSTDKSTSLNSFESYQQKAMKAIKALDEVVANEPSDDSSSVNTAPPLPPPPPPPAPPPLPPSGSKVVRTPSNPSMRVKRMNWEKIDVIDENMVWAKLGDNEDLEDIVKYLELEQQFSTKKNTISESFRDRKNEVSILNPKKAYNISILLGHLKKPVHEIKQSLYHMDEETLTPELLRQMLAYAADEKELEKYDKYKGLMDQLSKPDQFMYQISRVPGYEERMKAMLFKATFTEKVDEVRHNLQAIKRASKELQDSKRLEKILELVLAMGNYMNKGNQRVGEAVGFRISFLAQLERTKTSNNKGNFLNVLADAVSTKFPDSLRLRDDLPSVQEASKVSNQVIAEELTELRRVLQDDGVNTLRRLHTELADISSTVAKLNGQKPRLVTSDKFHDDMGRFITQASDEIQNLFSLHAAATQEFRAMITYFGEDAKNADTSEIFSVFAEFINKFEKAHLQNMQQRRNHPRGEGYFGPAFPKPATTQPNPTL